MRINIIGLGYVGLPLAILADSKGYEVTGIDINENLIKNLKEGKAHINFGDNKNLLLNSNIRFTTKYESIQDSDITLISVSTPVTKENEPDLFNLISVINMIKERISNDHLIIIESTVYPGTCEDIIKPLLDKTGENYLLAYCPERIRPGDKTWDIKNIPRIIGGINYISTKKAMNFYNSIIEAEIKEVSSIKIAEASKILENTFRDVNIAFINEMAKSFDKLGIDIKETIDAASTKPFGFLPHYPGVGVGGHCIPIDPHYLISKAKSEGFDHEILKLSRNINDSMPSYAVGLFENELSKLNYQIINSNVGILGLSYKGNVNDLRESPSLEIIKILKEKEANIFTYDPLLKNESTENSLSDLIEKVDYIILATDHNEFKKINALMFKGKIKIIIDGRNMLDKTEIQDMGIIYKGIGR